MIFLILSMALITRFDLTGSGSPIDLPNCFGMICQDIKIGPQSSAIKR